jgi:hypothetical protein
MGLWLAVMEMPPAAFDRSTASWTVGVGQTPMAVTSQPMERRVEFTMWAMGFPVILPSRPTMIFLLLQYSAKADVYLTIVSGVRLEPTIPRIPEILTINDTIVPQSAEECTKWREEKQPLR